MYIRKFSDEEVDKIAHMYVEQKMAISKIAIAFKASNHTIAKVLHTLNVVREVGKNYLYSCDETFFENIDNEQKAYWLGAMFADGNVSQNTSGTGQLFITSRDENWLEQFKETIQYTGKVLKETHKYYKKDIWKIHITSDRLFHDLCKIGCVPCKSNIIQFPNIKESLIHHFIRGYFDGDGTVNITKYMPNRTPLKSGFCSGSETFLAELVTHVPTKYKSIKHYSDVYTVVYSVNDSYKLYNYMYSDATVYLERKKNKFEEYAKERRSTTIISPSSVG